MITRRAFSAGLGLAALSGCVGGGGGAQTLAPRPAEAALPMAPNPAFDAWVAGFRARALARGVSAATYDSAMRGVGFIPGVVERDRNQTEFTRSTEDYLAIAASDERVSKGRAALARHGATLARIEARYGVEARVVTAVWGMESYYGERRGSVPVLSALATLAHDGRRGAFFEGQLVAALKIVQAGDITPARMTGSWAGAMGHTQFIPTSYLAYAVDFTGDGRRDIWSDDPTDALASAAAYLSRSGWRTGLPWGMEVILPAGFSAGLLGRGKGRGAEDWQGLGVRSASGLALQAGSIIAPGGVGGAAFLLTQNFNVILRYNNAENYALGVGHLSDRLGGGGPVRGAFPPDASGLSRADRQEIQRRLTALGFDTQGSDGVVGTNTRTAIERFEAARGLPVTGLATAALLARLRG